MSPLVAGVRLLPDRLGTILSQHFPLKASYVTGWAPLTAGYRRKGKINSTRQLPIFILEKWFLFIRTSMLFKHAMQPHDTRHNQFITDPRKGGYAKKPNDMKNFTMKLKDENAKGSKNAHPFQSNKSILS